MSVRVGQLLLRALVEAHEDATGAAPEGEAWYGDSDDEDEDDEEEDGEGAGGGPRTEVVYEDVARGRRGPSPFVDPAELGLLQDLVGGGHLVSGGFLDFRDVNDEDDEDGDGMGALYGEEEDRELSEIWVKMHPLKEVPLLESLRAFFVDLRDADAAGAAIVAPLGVGLFSASMEAIRQVGGDPAAAVHILDHRDDSEGGRGGGGGGASGGGRR